VVLNSIKGWLADSRIDTILNGKKDSTKAKTKQLGMVARQTTRLV